jgi:LacI family transcriptional regulator
VQEERVAAWLKGLARPLGLFACNDVHGQQVLNACREHRILVPEELAVVGVDNDIMLCELSAPPLSSVVPDTEKIGLEACTMLDRMMRQGTSELPTTFVGPLGMKTRQSTGMFAVADSNVAAAVRIIRDHACDGVNVQDVADRVALSRSTLERKFQKHLGRTPKEEILRVQMDRIRGLLINTDYSLGAIASMTGFRHPEYLSVVFRREAGETPIAFRRRVADQPRRSLDLPRLSDHD